MTVGKLVLFKPYSDPRKESGDIDSSNNFRDNWLKAACDLFDLELYTFEEIHEGDFKLIHLNILRETKDAQIIIADITGKSFNVYYELGLSHGFQLDKTIIVTNNGIDQMDELPFDIKPYRVHSYSTLGNDITYTKDNIETKSDEALQTLLTDIRKARYYRRSYKIGIAEYPELLAMYNFSEEGIIKIEDDILLELVPINWPRIKNALENGSVSFAIYNKALVEEENYRELNYIYYSNLLRYNSFYILGINDESVKTYDDFDEIDPIERCNSILSQFDKPIISFAAPYTDQRKIIDNLLNNNNIKSDSPYSQGVIKTSLEVSIDFIEHFDEYPNDFNIVFVGGINDRIDLLKITNDKGEPMFKLLFESKRIKNKYPYFSQYNGMVFLFQEEYPQQFFYDVTIINRWLKGCFHEFRRIFYSGERRRKRKLKKEDMEMLENYLRHYNQRSDKPISSTVFFENYILSQHLEIIK